jgi:MFS family permease
MWTLSDNSRLNLRILPAVGFTFVAYFAIGLPLAVLPSYVHLRLGASTVAAGLLISLQYVATFATRARAGRLSDTIGPRETVRQGLIACAASGLLTLLGALLQHSLWLSLGCLALGRLALGTGESLGATGATMWGIGRVGPQHTARVISWNGVATYTALAAGAPLGVLVASRWGLGAIGVSTSVLALASYLAATRMPATIPPRGERMPLGRILLRVTPYGLGLALGGLGFGVLATFITLYFAHHRWPGAALALTTYGLCFVATRLAFARCIDRFGGFRAAMASFALEAAGLALLGLGESHGLAMVGAGLTGAGFSLIFPALAVEAANVFPAAVRGSVLGVYSAFVDLALFLAGPLAGAVIAGYGYPVVFLGAAGGVLLALGLTIWLAAARGVAEPGDGELEPGL